MLFSGITDRGYVVGAAFWVAVNIYGASQFACLRSHACGTSDLVGAALIGLGMLIPAGIVASLFSGSSESGRGREKSQELDAALRDFEAEQSQPYARDEDKKSSRTTPKEMKGETTTNLETVLMAFAATRNKPKVRKAVKADIRAALQASQRLTANKDKNFAETEFRRMLSVAQKSRRAAVSRWEYSYDHPQWVSAILTETLFSNELSRLRGKITIQEYQAVVGNIARFAE